MSLPQEVEARVQQSTRAKAATRRKVGIPVQDKDTDFSFKLEMEDGTTQEVTLRSYGMAPGRISRRNIGNTEAQVWAAFDWGLIEPKHWPLDSEKGAGTDILDDARMRSIMECYNDWQSDAAITAGESPASKS